MGTMISIMKEAFPPKSQYSVDNIPDLTGKVVIVTGANTGIGKETAKALLVHNAKVYIAARSQSKAEEAIAELKRQTGKEGIWLRLDLSDLNSVKASAREFLSKEKELHILFNNAGVMIPPADQLTAQGYDAQWGTNVLGELQVLFPWHYYFTILLLPALRAATKTSPDGKSRVVNTSSSGHLMASKPNFLTFKYGPARRKLAPIDLYNQSILGNVLFSNAFARRYGSQGIVSISLNPGNLRSNLLRHAPKILTKLAHAFLLYPVSNGALTQLWAGTSAEGAGFNGKYLIPWARVGKPNPVGNDEVLQDELWTWFEEQVKGI
ncbi:hypothetical protein BJ165DRAFT_1345793 [Panaeolus papilionaceus]|nr:hypothetical protein BJ165DRAFT_1345793 [Panaeolus papilionaceus]